MIMCTHVERLHKLITTGYQENEILSIIRKLRLGNMTEIVWKQFGLNESLWCINTPFFFLQMLLTKNTLSQNMLNQAKVVFNLPSLSNVLILSTRCYKSGFFSVSKKLTIQNRSKHDKYKPINTHKHTFVNTYTYQEYHG